MALETNGEDLLGWIKSDIEEKYNVQNPIFVYNFKQFKTKDQIFEWINKNLQKERFIKYKKISNNTFELKDFSPDPPDKICFDLAIKCIDTVKKRAEEQYKKEPIFYICSSKNIIYEQKEIIKELIFYMRLWGQATIWEDINPISDPNPIKNRLIYNLVFHVQEIYFDIDSNFLELENKY